jgi:hypothetical protein
MRKAKTTLRRRKRKRESKQTSKEKPPSKQPRLKIEWKKIETKICLYIKKGRN